VSENLLILKFVHALPVVFVSEDLLRTQHGVSKDQTKLVL